MRVHVLGFNVVLLFAFLAVECIGQLLPSPWPMAGQNLQQTRVSPYVGPQTTDFYWSFLTVGQLSSEPVIGTDGTLYFGDSLGITYSVDPSGYMNWNLTLGAQSSNHQVLNSPVLGLDGSVYIACKDSYLYRISASGKLIWKASLGAAVIASPAMSATSDIIYVATFSTFMALYADTGDVYWTSSSYTTSYTPGIGSDGTIYLCNGNYLYALSSEGNLQWSCQVSTNSNLNVAPVVGPDNVIYVAEGSFVSAVYQGEVKWSSQVSGGAILANMILGPDGNIYLAIKGDSIYCFSPDGSLVWNYQTGSTNTIFTTPMMDIEGNLFVGTQSGLLYGISTSGGQPVEFLTYNTGSLSMTSPVITQSGILVIASSNNYLTAIKPGNCTAGHYVSPSGSSFCSKCSLGYYSTEDNSMGCSECSYPWTSIHEGQSSCQGILLAPEGSITNVALVFTAMAVVVMVCMYHGKQRVAIFMNLVFPTLDVFSDLAYLMTNEFYNVILFYACFASIAIPAIMFSKTLVERRARPSLYVKLRDSWWLRAGNDQDHIYYPIFPFFASNDGRLPFLSSREHSTFGSVLMEGIAWLLAITAQIATFVVVIPANILFLNFWYVVGAFLHMSKMITIGKVWNLWFQVWTQSTTHSTDVDVDTAELIQFLEEEFLTETIPQFIIQLINNLLLGRFSPIAAFSMTFSIVISINSVWRHVYHRFVRTDTMPLEEIPLGMVWRLKLDAWQIDWILVDARLQSASKKSSKECNIKSANGPVSDALTTTPLLANEILGDQDEEASGHKYSSAPDNAVDTVLTRPVQDSDHE